MVLMEMHGLFDLERVRYLLIALNILRKPGQLKGIQQALNSLMWSHNLLDNPFHGSVCVCKLSIVLNNHEEN